MRLNKEEVGLGFLFGASFAGVLGWYAILTGILCGILWGLGGSGAGRAFRYLGVPAVVVATLYWSTGSAWILSGLLGIIPLTIGYGVPSTQPPDEGSALGRWIYNVLREEAPKMLEEEAQLYASMLTRWTIWAILYGSFVALVQTNPEAYALGFLAFMVLGMLYFVWIERGNWK